MMVLEQSKADLLVCHTPYLVLCSFKLGAIVLEFSYCGFVVVEFWWMV